MKKLFAVLCIACMVASLSLAAVAADKATLTGIVTDEKCAKTDMAANADCAKKCIDGGQKAVFVNDKDKSVWPIDNPDAVKGHEGHHVTVTGSTANNTLHVDSVKMGKSKGKESKM